MKFNDKFPEHVKAPHTIGPHPEVQVGDKISQSWRVYPCGACKAPTGWRLELAEDFPPAPCCSEECQAQLLANNTQDVLTEEHVKEAFEAPAIANPSES